MVLTFIADVILDITFWTTKKVYNTSYWFIYGSPKSEMELLIEKQNETIKLLNENMLKLNEKIDNITFNS